MLVQVVFSSCLASVVFASLSRKEKINSRPTLKDLDLVTQNYTFTAFSHLYIPVQTGSKQEFKALRNPTMSLKGSRDGCAGRQQMLALAKESGAVTEYSCSASLGTLPPF